jgi:hypothetical protein
MKKMTSGAVMKNGNWPKGNKAGEEATRIKKHLSITVIRRKNVFKMKQPILVP